MEYRSIFIDLDDTLWAFTENARDTFEEMYHQYRFERYFQSFDHFMELYVPKNLELWDLYGRHEISKDELNARRFSYPLLQVGVDDPALVKAYSDGFFAAIPYKWKLMPHAMEALEYLSGKYRLYILSNGFRELQEQKMRSAIMIITLMIPRMRLSNVIFFCVNISVLFFFVFQRFLVAAAAEGFVFLFFP